MRCPYCTTYISDAAMVCPACTRDLYLIKPLQARIAELEEQVESLTANQARPLEEHLTGMAHELPQTGTSPSSVPEEPPKTPRRYVLSALIACLATLLLLLLAHGFMIMIYDLKPMYLRIASLLIPLPFGYFLFVRHPQYGWRSAGLGVVVAVAAVLGMSAVTGYVDQVPVLPQDLRDFKEFIEYAASIFFSLLTGMLLGLLVHRRRQARPRPGRLSKLLDQVLPRDEYGKLDMERLTELGASLAPVGTAAISIYTGIKSLLGDSS